MQLLISVEPDTRRAYPTVRHPPPTHPPSPLAPVRRPPTFAPTFLPVSPRPLLKRPSANSTSCRRASCRLVPENYPLAPFAAGWRRVTSLSKNGRCRLSLYRSASLSFCVLSCVLVPFFHLAPRCSSLLLHLLLPLPLLLFSLSLPLVLYSLLSRYFFFSRFFVPPPFSLLPLSSAFSLPFSRTSLRELSSSSFVSP